MTPPRCASSWTENPTLNYEGGVEAEAEGDMKIGLMYPAHGQNERTSNTYHTRISIKDHGKSRHRHEDGSGIIENLGIEVDASL